MRNILCRGLYVIVLLMCTGVVARAEYAPEVHVDDYPKDEVQKGVKALRAMPSLWRDSYIAEVMGLLFLPNNTAYDPEIKTHMDGYRYCWVKEGALFVSGTGRVYDIRKDVFKGSATRESAKMIKLNSENWKTARLAMQMVGDETILSFFTREVARIVQQTAKYHLKSMPTKLREEMLAELANLCYMPDGSSARSAKLSWTRCGTINFHQKVESWELKSGARFMDSQGKEQEVEAVRKRFARSAPNEELVRWCASLVGEKDILDLFSKEVKAMRAAYEQKMQQLGVDVADKPAEQKANTSPLSVQVGAAYRPEVDSTRMSATYRAELKSVVEYLRSLPKTTRWVFISERMGLLFMPQSGAVGISQWGWMEGGSHFIGADGCEYDSVSELKIVEDRGGRPEWNRNSDIVDRLGREVVFAELSEEVSELVLQNAKYEIEKMGESQPVRRDMFLAWLAGIFYTPEGEPAQSKEAVATGAHKKPIREVQFDAQSRFTDTRGDEWSIADVIEKYGHPHHDRWLILETCTHHIGNSAILALFAEEVKTLRDNCEKKMQELRSSATE